jgi:hypothetical protein
MNGCPKIPNLFVTPFRVDYAAPFRRHLNRLEVEIAREDYRSLHEVDLLPGMPPETFFSTMEEITWRILKTTQNNYNRQLLRQEGIRVYLDSQRYAVYYRLADRVVRFSAAWRRDVLRRFFGAEPISDSGWNPGGPRLPEFESRFLPDHAGGVLMVRAKGRKSSALPVLTVTHGPYDPHTLEVALLFLREGKGKAAIVNLGFSGREPLADEPLEKLKDWGIPLNPSNIDVIYPYADGRGHPYCYKLEECLGRFIGLLDEGPPAMIVDIHGCVGTSSDDSRIIVGLGGMPPYPATEDLGQIENTGKDLRLIPKAALRKGLDLLRGLGQIQVQFCDGPHRGYHFRMTGTHALHGRSFDPRREPRPLLSGEERTYLPAEDVRWLPGAGGNALQRLTACRLRRDALCLHVEIPTQVRRRVALALREREMLASFEASAL